LRFNTAHFSKKTIDINTVYHGGSPTNNDDKNGYDKKLADSLIAGNIAQSRPKLAAWQFLAKRSNTIQVLLEN